MGLLYGALGEAVFFTGVEKNQDIVTFASYAPTCKGHGFKLVYMSPNEDKVAIQLDCNVKDEYKAYLLTGEQTYMNSFESP